MSLSFKTRLSTDKALLKLSALSLVTFILAVSGALGQTADWFRLGPLQSGSRTAAVKIEVFYDLQCPSCANFHLVLRKLEQKYGNDLLITFRHFPLRIPAHDKAFMAARMVEAAHVQGKGREMLDLILANQRKWTTNKLAKTLFFGYAAKLKLDMPEFRNDFEYGESVYLIVDDLFRAYELKLRGTPSVFLNGKELTINEAFELDTKIKEIVK